MTRIGTVLLELQKVDFRSRASAGACTASYEYIMYTGRGKIACYVDTGTEGAFGLAERSAVNHLVKNCCLGGGSGSLVFRLLLCSCCGIPTYKRALQAIRRSQRSACSGSVSIQYSH